MIHLEIMQSSGVKDMDGNIIYNGDIIQFADKWEWYRSEYGARFMLSDDEARAKVQEQYDNEPLYCRVVDFSEEFDFLLSNDIQQYWKVIGNIYESPELMDKQN
jgi:uncharacterized phage protein (TIGR01671 family)